MNDIFNSEEFINFEKFCNSKKLSFAVCVSKLQSLKKTRNPVYAASEFFVFDIPQGNHLKILPQ